MVKIYSLGQFVPSVMLRRGEVVFDGNTDTRILYTVAVPGPGWWVDTFGMRHEGGAFEAIDTTDEPVVLCQIVDELKARGVL